MRELIDRLKAAEANGGTAADGATSSLGAILQQQLTDNWQHLRTLNVCHEPGQSTKRDGRTMWEQVQTKLAERKKKQQQQTKLPFTAAPAEATNGDAAAASSSSDGEKEEGRAAAAAPAAAPASMTKKASAGGDNVAMQEEGAARRTTSFRWSTYCAARGARQELACRRRNAATVWV